MIEIFALLLTGWIASSAAFTRGDCFVDYQIGETHEYLFDSQLHVSHDFSHQEGSESVNKVYSKNLLADITLIGVDDNDLFHFELKIKDGSYGMDDGLVAPFRRNDGQLPIAEKLLNQAYVRAHADAFYFTQNCAGEVVSVFHPKNEDAAVVNTKKMFVTQLSHRARADLQAHVEEERDMHGARDTAYEYDAQEDQLDVTKSFDTIRNYRPPAELRQTGDALNTWRARTADSQTTTLRDGIVHHVKRSSELDFPPTEKRYGGSVGRKRNELAEEEQDDDFVQEVKGNGFWIKARGASSLQHQGMRKRASGPVFEKAHLGDNFVSHLSKRHENAFTTSMPHYMESQSAPGPGSLEDTMADILSDDSNVESSIQLHLLLKHDKDNTLPEVIRRLPSDSPISDAARTRLMRVLAEVGGEQEQAVLRDLALDDAQDRLVRVRALTALRGCMNPEEATLDALRILMRRATGEQAKQEKDIDADPEASSTDAQVLRKTATLMFGVLAENVNATNVDLARSMRRDLLERFFFATSQDEKRILMAALDNCYEHGADSDTVLRDRIDLVRELGDHYDDMGKRTVYTRLMTRPGVKLPPHIAKRIAEPPPQFPLSDMDSCDVTDMTLMTVRYFSSDGNECIPRPDVPMEEQDCQPQTVRTDEQCPPPRCTMIDDPMCTEVVESMVNENGEPCGTDGADNTGAPCETETCSECTDCRDPDGRPCGALCRSAMNTICPEPQSWFKEQFTMFFGANLCDNTARWNQCAATIGKMYNDLRPLKPDAQWAKRIGGEPVVGKIEAVLDADTTSKYADKKLPTCQPDQSPWEGGQAVCEPEGFLAWKVFAGAWAGLEAFEKGATYDYNPNAARLEVASAYLQVKSQVEKYWLNEDDPAASSDAVCDTPVEFGLFYAFAGKTYYHETTKDIIKDRMGKSTCYLADQTCHPTKPPERAWSTSTKDLYTRYLPDLLSEYDLSGIPLKLELLVKSEARVHHAVVYQFNEFEGGLMLSGFVEPQADCIVTMTASISWAARWGNTDEAAQTQEMRNLIKVGIKAHLEVFAVEFPAIGAINFETANPCASVNLHTRALGGRVDVILEVMGVNVFQFLGGLFGVKQTLFEWKGIEFDINMIETKCCKLCPGSCQDQEFIMTGEGMGTGVNGKHSRCDFSKGECLCTPGWDGETCMIPCPEDCETDLGILCDIDQPFTVGGGRFAPRDRCKCEAGSWGYDCSLACPGGRKNPCSGHTDKVMTWKDEEHKTCNSDGTCDCWDFPPRGPWFGSRCDITCGDPKMEHPEDDPNFTRCGPVGESFAECKYDAALGAAECKCARNWYGEKCDKQCPRSDDDRQAACSLRGDCEEVDGAAVCLCDLGFYGSVCEFIAFEGSGLALAFNNTSPEQKVEYPLTPIQLQAEPSQGFTTMFWFQPHELPTATIGPSLFKWRWADIRLAKDGSVELCDATRCLASKKKVEVGFDESSWYWVAASYVNDGDLGTGSRQIWLMKVDDGQLGVPAENTEPMAAMGGDTIVVGAAPFRGLIDHVHMIHRVATEVDLVNYREGTVAWSTPGLLFQALCDTGRGDHVYAETPFIAGPKHESVDWARSFVPLKWASLNSDIAPPLKIALPDKPALRAYDLVFDGKRINKGYLSFRVLSPMKSGRKRSTACRISAYLVDPSVVLKTYDANDNPLSDEQLREMDKRSRFPIFENRELSGSELSDFIDPIELNRDILKKLRTGVTEIEWKMMEGQPECHNMDTPFIIENSFLTLHVEQVDGMAQSTGGAFAYMSTKPKTELKGSWAIEMWLFQTTVRTGSVANDAIFMLYPDSVKTIDLVNTKPDLALFLLSDTEKGGVVRYGSANAQVLGYDIEPIRGRWFHLQMGVTHASNRCTPNLFVDGVAVGNVQDAACGAGVVPNFDNKAYSLRILPLLQARINDFIIWNAPNDAASNMHMLKNFGASSMLLGFDFDDKHNMQTTAADTFLLRDTTGKNQDVSFVKGVFRGHIYGAIHRWKLCPGIDPVLEPERVCGNTLIQERGVCIVEDEENEGIIELTYKCKCNEGFAGKACQKQCLGEIRVGGKTVLCSGHGRCLTVDAEDDVVCECDEGFAGDGCEHVCPGWDTSNPPGQKECNGAGQCKMNTQNTAAVCKCTADSNRYGLSCEYTQNALPLIGCDECTGQNEACVDGICDCEHPFYRVGEHCQEAQPANMVRPLFGLMAALLIAVMF